MDVEVPGILALSHGSFAEEIVKSAEMIIGKQENVCALGLLPGQDPADFIAKVRKVLQSMPQNTLILSDLFGGTPSNVSAALVSSGEAQAVTGLNMPMLIEACTARYAACGAALAAKAAEAGGCGCKNIGEEIRRFEDDI